MECCDRGGCSGITEDQDQHRNAQHPAQLAGARHDRRSRGVAAARHRRQRGAAQERQGRPHPDAAEHLSWEPLCPERRHQSHLLVVPEIGTGPRQGARNDERAVAMAVGQWSQPCRDDGRDQRARHQSESGTQDVVPPDVLQPQDVGEQVGVKPHTGQNGRDRGDGEGRDPQERRVQQRGMVGPRTEHEQDQQQRRCDERTDDTSAVPAPVAALHDAEVERAQAADEQGGAAEVRQGTTTRRPTLHQLTACRPQGRDPERQIHQERPAPAAQLDQRSAHRRSQPRGDRR